MERTLTPTEVAQPILIPTSTLQVLLSQSEDDFYGSLQRFWNTVAQTEE
ncbi:hypothetical protein [Spirosoma lituiforme]